jgi:hypothetical protein
MQLEITITPQSESYLAKAVAYVQRFITGTPEDHFAFYFGNTLYVPDDYAERLSENPNQYDVGALTYYVTLMAGRPARDAAMEEKRLLDMADHHFASGPPLKYDGGIAADLFESFVDKIEYIHSTKRLNDRRPFRAWESRQPEPEPEPEPAAPSKKAPGRARSR